jgi:hypothetical protein
MRRVNVHASIDKRIRESRDETTRPLAEEQDSSSKSLPLWLVDSRLVWDEDPNPSPNSRCRAWENTIVFRSRNRNEAYAKAVKLGSRSANVTLDGGHWLFVGLTSLLPIYHKLEDGAEILWEEHANRTVRKIDSLAKQKNELEVFDNTPQSETCHMVGHAERPRRS